MQLQLEAAINCSREEASGELIGVSFVGFTQITHRTRGQGGYPILSSLHVQACTAPYRTYDLCGKGAGKEEDQTALDPANKHLSLGRPLPFSLFPSPHAPRDPNVRKGRSVAPFPGAVVVVWRW